MHEESQVSPKVVVLMLVLVEVQTQMLKLVAALATNEAYKRIYRITGPPNGNQVLGGAHRFHMQTHRR